MCLRPATPGFVITLAATICLAIVCFSVPWLRTVYFLKVTLTAENQSGDVIFGALGYCSELPGNTTCVGPKVGYQFDPNELNQLLGLDGVIKIPDLFVSWLTYPLVLHVVGLILAAIAALFGLLAHVREMSMTCFSSCFSGFAATIVLIAFIFDLVIFFLARARMNSVSGGSASIGNAVWLTLAGWLLLFFAGCAFGFGRCCITRRPSPVSNYGYQAEAPYHQAMRLDAIKAETDRKARQQGEAGLPAFPGLPDAESRPLNTPRQEPEYLYLKDDDDEGSHEHYRDRTPSPVRQGLSADLVTTPHVQSYDGPYQPVFRSSGPNSAQAYSPLRPGSQPEFAPYAQMPEPLVSGNTQRMDARSWPPEAALYESSTAAPYISTNPHYAGHTPGFNRIPQPVSASQNPGSVSLNHAELPAAYPTHDSMETEHYGANPNDYIDPYSTHIDELRNPQSPTREVNDTKSRSELSAYDGNTRYPPSVPPAPGYSPSTYQRAEEYQSPYLPQPASPVAQQTPATYGAYPQPMPIAGSPTSPRGPRPPSYGR